MAKFIDQVKIMLKAGKGGDGMISFRREAHVDKGGPDGGDGGTGGNIYFVADLGKNTLLSFYKNKFIIAEDGVKGGPKNLYGAKGKDTIVKVPLGTLVYKNKKLVADVIKENHLYLVAKGGKGGRGNNKFKTSKNTAPRIAENGMPGEKYEANIVLKILSDVGLVGLPSCGKSTLITALSNAKAKVAEYEFTTLVPQLGLVKYYDYSYTIADLPGLIKGASLGKGLGIQFLRHIERCKVVIHIVDFGSPDKDPIQSYEAIQKELESYKLNLTQKPQLVVANKSDLANFKNNIEKFKAKYPNIEIIEISALNYHNVENLKKIIWEFLEKTSHLQIKIEDDFEIEVKEINYEPDFVIQKMNRNHFKVTGKKIEELVLKIPINTFDNLMRFNNILKKIGVWETLIKRDIQKGDLVEIYQHKFEWEEEL
ncbi:GTPase ObgE [Mycoplasmopsis synoviae]|uniref:GTPase ObgE n=1 Tax=Mycoplasmopsis synoviae TaxID=2109 RepID=UPI001CE05B1D|nr:GTPase ObgE [Mycoplasmopsis synoviae]UBX98824.1 GTPase ObgE [Mycoplasmopsis synoviae]